MPRDTVEVFQFLPALKPEAPSPAASDDVLRALKAARELTRRKWQGRLTFWQILFHIYDLNACAYLNISRSAPNNSLVAMEASRLFGRVIGVEDITDIWAWNDARGRKKQEVIAAFDRAISSRLAEIEG